MTNSPNHTLRSPRFSAAQRQALNAIGHALKHRTIDFHTATELSDMVKAGRIAEVLRRLEDNS